MTTLNPYLTFNGNCEAAFHFYQSVFGGEFAHVGRYKEMPDSEGFTIAEAEKEKIMHISLPIGESVVLMGCDSSEAYGKATVIGNNVSISINTDSQEDARRLFDGLSASGTIKMPLKKTFWGSIFGMFTDKFGIHWMVNCDL